MSNHLIGLISDTHSLIRPESLKALDGVEHIIHAGDVGTVEVLDALQGIAPVTAVQGNIDTGKLGASLPVTEVVKFNGVMLYVLHDISTLDLNPTVAGFRAVIYGHSHQPLVEERDSVLYINPGSAGPRRFKLPASLALLRIEGTNLTVELIELNV